jgi:hypothetical protein
LEKSTPKVSNDWNPDKTQRQPHNNLLFPPAYRVPTKNPKTINCIAYLALLSRRDLCYELRRKNTQMQLSESPQRKHRKMTNTIPD